MQGTEENRFKGNVGGTDSIGQLAYDVMTEGRMIDRYNIGREKRHLDRQGV